MNESLKQKLLRLQSECYKIVKTNTRIGSMLVSTGQMARKQAFDEVLVLLDEATKQIREKAKTKCDISFNCSTCANEDPLTCEFKTHDDKYVSLEKVLAVLEGNGKEKTKP